MISLFYFFLFFLTLASALQQTPQNLPGPVRYNFQYFVRNDETGDFKNQHEVREGDTVRGSYSLAEPNGDLRVVTYQADQKNGFNAKVQVQPRGIQIPFPPVKSFHPLVDPPTSHYPPLDIKVLAPSTEPSKKIVDVYIDDETAPESTTGRALSTTSATDVRPPCPLIDHYDNRYRPPASHQKVVPPLTNVPATPLYFQPNHHMNNGPPKPMAMSPMWAFMLVPAQG